ncbi:MAG: TauD/TfdA family dioxygenase [Pseudomonadota bacterium]
MTFLARDREWVQVRDTGPLSLDTLIAALGVEAEQTDATLLRHGGLLLRNTAVSDAADFERLAACFLETPDAYIGGVSRRSRQHNRVYNTTEAPQGVTIEQHLEATHTPRPPARILFHCRRAPAQGGETPLASFVELFDALPAEIIDRVQGESVVYSRQLIDARSRLYKALPGSIRASLALSWQEVAETDDYETAIATFEAAGYDTTRSGRRGIATRCAQPVVSEHPVTGQPRWYLSDQITRPLAWYVRLPRRAMRRWLGMDFSLASGARLPQALLDTVHETLARLQFRFTWREGDVLVLDNEQMSHGRAPYAGDRLILTAFG